MNIGTFMNVRIVNIGLIGIQMNVAKILTKLLLLTIEQMEVLRFIINAQIAEIPQTETKH